MSNLCRIILALLFTVICGKFGFAQDQSTAKKWRTYVYYNDAQLVSGTPGNPCGGYNLWDGQRWFSVSQIEITEQ